MGPPDCVRWPSVRADVAARQLPPLVSPHSLDTGHLAAQDPPPRLGANPNPPSAPPPDPAKGDWCPFSTPPLRASPFLGPPPAPKNAPKEIQKTPPPLLLQKPPSPRVAVFGSLPASNAVQNPSR